MQFFGTYLLGAFDSSMQPQPTVTLAVNAQSAGAAVQVIPIVVLRK